MIKLKTLLTEGKHPQLEYILKLCKFNFQIYQPKLYKLCKLKIRHNNYPKDLMGPLFDFNYTVNENQENIWRFVYNIGYEVISVNGQSKSSITTMIALVNSNTLIINPTSSNGKWGFIPTGNHMEDEHELEQLFLHPFNSKILSLLSDNKFQEILKYLHAK